ncbi:hypothetical protein E8E13_002040 [Curvularia kusanoi]|uniref:Uncharacterized protein n=1 Tax=Curvularia kusanoi TaxID=90978 RepID=A0A9P4W5I9_CURKU|nr:hypothetical protein E8E13_002040 [Curvularia kusanoi]
MLLDYPTSVIGRATTRPHWRCEAGTLSGDAEKQSWLKVFAVCKQIRDEAADLMQRTATFHLSDLDVLRHFSEHAAVSPTKPYLAAFLFQRASRIVISPTFPPAIYRALEQTEDTAISKPDTNVIANTWRTIGSDLAGLPNLAKVTLWFDHDEPFRWAFINEKALLSTLAHSICGSNVDFHVYLPHLHPDYEDAGKHFTDLIHAPFILTRRTRQWYDQGESCKNVNTETRKKDLADSFEMFKFGAELLENSLSAELERNERGYWKAGMYLKDIAADMRAIFGLDAAVSYNV